MLYEFLIATKAGIKTLDESWRSIDIDLGLSLVRAAIQELTSRALPVEFLRGVVSDLASEANNVAVDDVYLAEAGSFKDVVLDSLANHGNVAQFVSFSPSLDIRYSRIAGYAPNIGFESASAAIDAILRAAVEHSVNVRSYHPDHPKSREFIYGLRELTAVEAALNRLSGEGLYTIVNETVTLTMAECLASCWAMSSNSLQVIHRVVSKNRER